MPLPLEQFVKQLEDSGILAGDTLKDFIPPKASPKDAEDLARELVRNKKLTKFQAEEVYKGKAKSLVLGNYVLIEKIGAGGMGQVFKARHWRMDRIVAVKLLPAAMTKDKAAIARFEREVMAAAKISHPNIVTAYDADQANGVRFLVMECVEGSDLSALVKKNGPFSVDKAVNYILQAARGLEAAHARGIVHRDIKPANLLLDKQGTVKILDMGLARLSGASDDPTEAELTKTGTIMGTVDYMAPEQALNTKTADARADIYSLGCSLYYLIAGKATYDGDTLTAKLLAHQNQSIPSLRTAQPEVSEQVEAIFRMMLAKKVDDRYQSMTAVIAELEQCGSHQQQSTNTQPSLSSSTESGLTDFLKDVSVTPKKPKPPVPPKPKKILLNRDWINKNKKALLIGAGVLGALTLLMGVIVSLRTKDGTLTVKVNEPDAEVQVLSEEGVVEITRKSQKGRITISVDPGKHRLKVVKDGFEFFVKDFEMESGGNETITARLMPLDEKPAVARTKPASVAGAQKPLAFQTPGFDQWVQEVAALPAEKQVKAVSKKLMELNPGFDGKVTGVDGQGSPKIESGVVTALGFVTTHVTDISPVRALSGLRFLACLGSVAGKGQLADLSPLKGMPLTSLEVYFNQVTDISSLSGMKPSNVNLSGTKVGDLSPLMGMDLNNLNIDGTLVTDLSPLKGMVINTLQFSESHVTDLSSLKDLRVKNVWFSFKPYRDTAVLRSIKTLETINGKPVAEFWKEVETQQAAFDQWIKDIAALPADQQVQHVVQNLQEFNPEFDGKVTPTIESGVVTGLQFLTDDVTDISPVRALTGLVYLICRCSEPGIGTLADLSPLRGMALTSLDISLSRVNDLSPIKGMPLTTLNLRHSQVADLTPLKGMLLKDLDCGGTPVSDLSPISGMPLVSFGCYITAVTDLSSLQGMPLTALNCAATQVSDLSPLKGMPLKTVGCYSTPVSDLSPLQGMDLTELSFQNTQVSDLSPLKGMKLTVLTISTQVSDISPIKDMPLLSLSIDFKPFRDTELIRSIKTLETINRKPVADFWKEAEAKQAAFDQWTKEVAALPAEQQVEAVAKKLVELNPGFDGKVTDYFGGATPQIENGVVIGFGFLTDQVTDISPVRALARLRQLRCPGSGLGKGKLADLSPLKGMNLADVLFNSTQVTDLSPLRDMKLTTLSCFNTRVSDLTPLKEVKLIGFTCNQTQVSDLSPLKDMKLTVLSCGDTKVTDLSPLKDMPLTGLSIEGSLVSDLSPLKGMSLTSLKTESTQVSDLSPLKGMPLEYLVMANTSVTDLSPLQGMPLTYFECRKTKVNDFSLLKEMPLKYLALDFKPERDTALLRSIKTLETINDKPVAEFWKELEATKP